jgi:hypothetical protein
VFGSVAMDRDWEKRMFLISPEKLEQIEKLYVKLLGRKIVELFW